MSEITSNNMIIKTINTISLSGLLFTLLFLATPASIAEDINKDFFQMQGKQITHSFIDKQDSLSAQEIVELSNENGVPVWFGRKVRKVVCLTGECQIANLWLFWNGVGDYLGFQLYNNEPLTKTDHKEFNSEDYKKLHLILSDPNSILKETQHDELIEKPNPKELIDGISGATHLSYKEYLVENAAYTCYTLWHTVYGNTMDNIHSMLEQRTNSAYLQSLFNQENYEYKIWAIKQIAKNPALQNKFNDKIMSFLLSDVELLSQQALNYFTGDILSDYDIQLGLVNMFDKLSYSKKFQIILNLTQQKKTNDQAIIQLLHFFENQQINAYSLSFIYNSIHAENLKNPTIYKKIKKISNHENNYVKEISQKLLERSN